MNAPGPPDGPDPVIDLAAVLAGFDEPWSPRTVAVVNDYDVRVFKAAGAFTRHRHPDTDEFSSSSAAVSPSE